MHRRLTWNPSHMSSLLVGLRQVAALIVQLQCLEISLISLPFKMTKSVKSRSIISKPVINSLVSSAVSSRTRSLKSNKPSRKIPSRSPSMSKLPISPSLLMEMMKAPRRMNRQNRQTKKVRMKKKARRKKRNLSIRQNRQIRNLSKRSRKSPK